VTDPKRQGTPAPFVPKIPESAEATGTRGEALHVEHVAVALADGTKLPLMLVWHEFLRPGWACRLRNGRGGWTEVSRARSPEDAVLALRGAIREARGCDLDPDDPFALRASLRDAHAENLRLRGELARLEAMLRAPKRAP
jgi:hypothetical protein